MATVVIAQFFTGILADRYSKWGLILIGALIGSVSSLLCVVATHWTQLAILRVIGGIADANIRFSKEANDAEVSTLFRQIADDEKIHKELLNAEIQALKETQKEQTRGLLRLRFQSVRAVSSCHRRCHG